MEVTINNTLADIGIVLDSFAEYAGSSIQDHGVIHKLSIVIDEVLSNIIYYGYEDNETHKIHISCQVTGQKVNLKFKDDGIPFNPLKVLVAEPILAVEDLKIGGLGIKLIKNFSDDLKYQRNNNSNELYITKFIP